MLLEVLEPELSVCKVECVDAIWLRRAFTFVGVTDEEVSLICPTDSVPENTLAREDGWRAFRIEGELDFSLIGILSHISSTLADAGVGLFVISTYNTDYVLVKASDLERALDVLEATDSFDIRR